ncbi:hypothetical protein IVB18_50630 (plasmid) [Bradyrhizobium sp. 186]|uniref:hypothetical protein n=1 Tax=Bradyrhizobium sp. 186 TaxID=2782654 RepID=UPI002000EC72|nr:hypothetical protein [Bradyrhizobium sp. 186]UPK40876.1 hypothetical protein IVB18_50630 [Bradyrhizobium sp. 186]
MRKKHACEVASPIAPLYGLPEQAVREFAQLFEQIYSISLDPDEAAFRARNFLNLYRAALRDDGPAGTSHAVS